MGGSLILKGSSGVRGQMILQIRPLARPVLVWAIFRDYSLTAGGLLF
ncbi:MAG: hypothetical protein ACTHZ1_04120 [Sphingobacterium sp.]